MGLRVVWLKRDLRLRDHAPLAAAARAGRVVLLYVDEPALLHSAEFDSSQLQFQRECLREIDTQLAPLGGYIARRTGSVPQVLDELRERHGVAGLWPHAETGNQLTYARDQQVAAWARAHAIPWTELPQTGVIRRLKSRDGWAARWNAFMSRAPSELPEHLAFATEVPRGRALAFAELGVPPSSKPLAQRGGDTHAHALLESFLEQRGVDYRRAMASPVSGWDGCSRLGPHLAWCAICPREVHQALQRRRESLREEQRRGGAIDSRWLGSLSSFAGRLRWRSDFMQKLEDEPALEFENMNRSYDEMREGEFDSARFVASCEGRTGCPMVDACMRCLHASGWINFRTRAVARLHRGLPPVAALAAHFCVPRAPLPRLRTRHPLPSVPDAVGRHRHQHGPHLLARQAGARPGSPRRVPAPLAARTRRGSARAPLRTAAHAQERATGRALHPRRALSAADRRARERVPTRAPARLRTQTRFPRRTSRGVRQTRQSPPAWNARNEAGPRMSTKRESARRGNGAPRPEKPCAACGRPMQWRKRWERVWDAIRYCSERCRRRGTPR